MKLKAILIPTALCLLVCSPVHADSGASSEATYNCMLGSGYVLAILSAPSATYTYAEACGEGCSSEQGSDTSEYANTFYQSGTIAYCNFSWTNADGTSGSASHVPAS